MSIYLYLCVVSTYLLPPLILIASFLAYVAILSVRFIFGKATSSYFFRVTFLSNTTATFSEQLFLLFQISCFFEELLFQNSDFSSAFLFRMATCQSKTSTEQLHLENRKFFSVVTFQNSYLHKISKKELLFRTRCICRALNFFKKQDFRKRYFFRKLIFHIACFTGELPF